MKIVLGALALASGTLKEVAAYEDGSIRAVFNLTSGQTARITMTSAEARALATGILSARADLLDGSKP